LELKIVFFTFYYPPDLSAGSFRAVALAEALSLKMEDGDELHVITTHPNRYANHRVKADDLEEVDGKITVHRTKVPMHKSGMIFQARSFGVYATVAYRLCLEINPDFLIGTTGRLMTGVLTGLSAFRLRKNYFIDLRDIFSETISDLFAKKNILLGYTAKKIFSFLDGRLLVRAAGVNVVSEGFYDYFKSNGIDTNKWSFFPNGVDQEFVEFKPAIGNSFTEVKTILYAGNIGSGQGLETVVPKLAKQLGSNFRFVIVGDGGTANMLKKAIKKDGINNVELIEPVSRTEIMRYYHEADILFLHLNDLPAFERVLPSKIFEYAALGKPIVAGLRGYSAKFMQEHVSYANIFEPGDYKSAALSVSKSINTKVSAEVVNNFVKKYSRYRIMDDFAEHILFVIKNMNIAKVI
jgi:glycosyltransferase involved in cell wall biosynthesis